MQARFNRSLILPYPIWRCLGRVLPALASVEHLECRGDDRSTRAKGAGLSRAAHRRPKQGARSEGRVERVGKAGVTSGTNPLHSETACPTNIRVHSVAKIHADCVRAVLRTT